MADLAYIGTAEGISPQPMLCINSAAEADAAYLAGKIDDDMRAACVRWFTRNAVRQVTLVKVVGEVGTMGTANNGTRETES